MNRIKINIGCGMSPTPNWHNYDNSFSVRISKIPNLLIKFLLKTKILNQKQCDYVNFCKNNKIKHLDIRKKLPFPNESIAIIYTSHVLEHLTKVQFLFFIEESYRVLKIGGILRIALPDLKIFIDRYTQKPFADVLIKELCMIEDHGTSILERIKFLIIGPRNHQWMYDISSAILMLEKTKFRNIFSMPAGSTNISAPGDLNLYERQDESFYIELVK
jgi:SAM-dependent methyltransferase